MTRAVCGGGLVRLAVLSLRPPERMLVMPAIFTQAIIAWLTCQLCWILYAFFIDKVSE